MTAGLRYTQDKRSIEAISGNQTPVTVTIPPQKRSDSKLTYRLALSQQFTDSVMAFGSVSRGLKSGLYSVTAPGSPAVAPATLDAYEVVLKADLFDRRFRMNVLAFLNNYKDVQVSTRNATNTANLFLNAAKVRSKGIEADVTAIASEELSFTGGLAYRDSKFRSFKNAHCITPAPGGISNVTASCDVSGNRTVQSPELVLTLAMYYKLETSIGALSFSATGNHNSGYYIDVTNRVGSGSYDLVNTSLRWTP